VAGVRFQHVTKRFGRDGAAVDDLSLEVEDGEFLVLVGPSGCGKSTTLRMLAGLEDVTSGEIHIGDRRVDRLPAKDRDIAMVFQSYALYPHMTVFDNMAFGLRLAGVAHKAIEDRVQGAAQTLGLEDLLSRKPGALSGGQRQRVALGRAIVREPSVFLLDEPLSNLDAKLRVQTRADLSLLHERLGTTFIYVTHDQVEAMTMATRIAVMRDGVLQQLGTPQDLYDHPRNRFVAGFIGSPEMNFFEAHVVDAGEGLAWEFASVRIPVTARHVAALAPFKGCTVTLGIRPEHLDDPQHALPAVGHVPVEARVEVVERLGSETLLHLAREGQRFLARVSAHSTARVGDSLAVLLDADEVHAFDCQSGLAIT
jgi:multiple sugar transport system ATP-binding protein